MSVAVTVVFATYNGALTLPRMLEALCGQTLDRARWKLVAVDNNSTDATRTILESYLHRLPLEIVSEPRQGKAIALDTGFRHLEGGLVVLTDDDVIPEPDWLVEFLAVADENPDVDLFGGLIRPLWDKVPEPWVQRYAHLGILYAANEELAEGPIAALLISGPNSAFRRRAITRSYLTQDKVGPDGASVMFPMGEDTAFAMGLERQGHKAMHTRRARVGHIVKPAYIEESWMLQRAVRYGMGLVAVRPELFATKLKFSGVPVASAMRWLLVAPVAALAAFLPRSRARHRLLWAQAVRYGILHQAFAARRPLPPVLAEPPAAPGSAPLRGVAQ